MSKAPGIQPHPPRRTPIATRRATVGVVAGNNATAHVRAHFGAGIADAEMCATAEPGLGRPSVAGSGVAVAAYSGHGGATAASVREEQRTTVCRGVGRALAAAGVSASKEPLAERDP